MGLVGMRKQQRRVGPHWTQIESHAACLARPRAVRGRMDECAKGAFLERFLCYFTNAHHCEEFLCRPGVCNKTFRSAISGDSKMWSCHNTWSQN